MKRADCCPLCRHSKVFYREDLLICIYQLGDNEICGCYCRLEKKVRKHKKAKR